MQDKNMIIRNFFYKLNELNKQVYKSSFPNIDGNFLLRNYNAKIFQVPTNKKLYNSYRYMFNSDEEYREFLTEISLVLTVVIQDLYMWLKEKEIFSDLKQHIRNHDIEKIISDENNIDFIIAPLFEMLNASALRKVELFKSLSDEDIKLLESLNPFFKEEYDHYNISITKEFLIKHINIWKKKKDYETAITMITKFLIKIFNVNIEEGMKIAYAITNDPEEQINILTYLNNNDFDSLAPIIRNTYENSLTEINKLN